MKTFEIIHDVYIGAHRNVRASFDDDGVLDGNSPLIVRTSLTMDGIQPGSSQLFSRDPGYWLHACG